MSLFNQDATDEATSIVQSTAPEIVKAAFSQGGGGMQLMRCEKRRRYLYMVNAGVGQSPCSDEEQRLRPWLWVRVDETIHLHVRRTRWVRRRG
jgi:hypothetical protein